VTPTRPRFLPAVCLLAVVATAPAADKPRPPALADLKAANTLVYAPDGSFVVIDLFVPRGRADTLGAWDTKTGECRVLFEKSHSSWERLAVTGDGKKAAAVSVGQMEVKVWDVATGKLLETQQLPKWRGSALSAMFLAFSPDNDRLYTTFDKRVLEVKLGGANRLIADKVEVDQPSLTAFDPKLKRLVSARNFPGRKPEAELVVTDLANDGEPTRVSLDALVGAIALSNDGKALAVSFGGVPDKAKLELWDTDGWKRRGTLAGDKRGGFAGYRQLVFAPDGKALAGSPTFAKPTGKIVTFLDLDGKVVAEASGKSATDLMAFSPDGKTLAVRLLDNKRTLLFFDPATGEEKKP